MKESSSINPSSAQFKNLLLIIDDAEFDLLTSSSTNKNDADGVALFLIKLADTVTVLFNKNPSSVSNGMRLYAINHPDAFSIQSDLKRIMQWGPEVNTCSGMVVPLALNNTLEAVVGPSKTYFNIHILFQ